jgi:hypothetical protein
MHLRADSTVAALHSDFRASVWNRKAEELIGLVRVGSQRDGTPASQNHSPRGPHARDGYFVPDVMRFCPV